MQKKTHPQVCLQLNQRLPILPGRLQPSTFGVYELNYCVRDGNRWTLVAIATESVRVCTLKTTQKVYIFVAHFRLLLLSKALDLLVPVSSKPHGSSTPGLSTMSSTWDLTSLCYEKPHLKAGFTLRCFQRLSVPNVATQLYPWQDNWYTSGSSTPVLSYQEQPPSSFLRPRWIGTELSHDVLNPAHVPL